MMPSEVHAGGVCDVQGREGVADGMEDLLDFDQTIVVVQRDSAIVAAQA